MQNPTYTLETKFLKNHPFVAGVDEVGRGSLAGPVVAAAVILDPNRIGAYRTKTKWWSEVSDSKTLSPRKREPIAEFIRENALDFAIGAASNREVDEINIHQASLLAMRRALERLSLRPGVTLVDGLHAILGFTQMQQSIIDGDARVLSIAAASILAKVYRDDLMRDYSQEFSKYGFASHKGYDTDFHRNQLYRFGPCAIHRLTFAPVREAMNERFNSILSSRT